MTKQDVVRHWQKRARGALKMAGIAHREGEYELALFHCHLALEKALKAKYMEQHEEEAPYIHDLYLLAENIQTEFSHAECDLLKGMTAFAVESRYSDPPWSEKEATKERSQEWLDSTTKLFQRLLP
jgi:HEPN domain-containing protein